MMMMTVKMCHNSLWIWSISILGACDTEDWSNDAENSALPLQE